MVFGLIVYALVRYRRRPDDDGGEPAQVYGSTQVEIAWTVTPVLIVVVLSLTGARAIDRIQNAPRPPASLDVTAIGHQWWWEFRYPSLGIVTANELHVPVSDPASPTPTFLKLLSADVVHSFWVPRLAGKTDLIPNRVNEMWIAPEKPGLYLGQCAEYCGTQHAKMLLRVYVHARDDFDRWVGEQRQAGAQSQNVAEGRRSLRDDLLHQLPRGRRHGRHRHLRARPHPSHEPRDAGVRRRAEHAREPAHLDREPRACEAGLADAGDEPDQARARRARGVSRDAAMSVEGGGTSVLDTVTLTGPRTGAAPLFDRLHEWVVTVDHKRLGLMYVVYALVFLVIGGLEAAIMRIQLAYPNLDHRVAAGVQPPLHDARHDDGLLRRHADPVRDSRTTSCR